MAALTSSGHLRTDGGMRSDDRFCEAFSDAGQRQAIFTSGLGEVADKAGAACILQPW